MDYSKSERMLKGTIEKLILKGSEIIEQCGRSDVLLNLRNAGNISSGNLCSQVNDYIFFCFVKSTNTLKSINTLIRNGQYLDSLMLVRSIYENYLYARYVEEYPQKIKNFLSYPIGREIGLFQRVGKHRLLDLIKGKEVEDYEELSIYKIADSIGECEIYKKIYTYLCDFTHPNPNTIGTLIKYDWFTINDDKYKFQALLHSVYCFLKIIVFIFNREYFEGKTLNYHLPRLIEKTKKDLINLLSFAIFEIKNGLEINALNDCDATVCRKQIEYYDVMIKDINNIELITE